MTKKIILIEADPVFVAQMKSVIKNNGASKEYEIISPTFPKRARATEDLMTTFYNSTVSLIEKFGDDIEGVLCDVRIVESDPKDTLGVDIALKIKQKYPFLPVINVTNHYSAGDINLFGEITLEEIDGVLPKEYFTSAGFSKQRLKNIFEAARKKSKNKISITEPKRSKIVISSDVGIITALQAPEFEAVMNVFGLKSIDSKLLQFPDTSKYYQSHRTIGNKKISIVAASDDRMGMPATTSLATRLILQFKPKFLIIVGICAGLPGCNIGDVLVADHTFDYGSGKNHVRTVKGEGKTEVFTPYNQPYNLDESLRKAIAVLRSDKTLLEKIKTEAQGFKTNKNRLNVHIGPFPSGAAVIANGRKVTELKLREGKLIGFDMEAYGIFYAASNCKGETKALSIKSVSDFGDEKKKTPLKEEHQIYASYTSALFLREVIEKVLFS